jgi:hypothetical protein
MIATIAEPASFSKKREGEKIVSWQQENTLKSCSKGQSAKSMHLTCRNVGEQTMDNERPRPKSEKDAIVKSWIERFGPVRVSNWKEQLFWTEDLEQGEEWNEEEDFACDCRTENPLEDSVIAIMQVHDWKWSSNRKRS